MRGSPDMVWRTHGRTDGRTHKRESIGLSAEAERPKKGETLWVKTWVSKLEEIKTSLWKRATKTNLADQSPPSSLTFSTWWHLRSASPIMPWRWYAEAVSTANHMHCMESRSSSAVEPSCAGGGVVVKVGGVFNRQFGFFWTRDELFVLWGESIYVSVETNFHLCANSLVWLRNET